MTKAQQIFEAIQRSKGHTDFSKSPTGKYNVQALQIRWAYFSMGWEMNEATK